MPSQFQWGIYDSLPEPRTDGIAVDYGMVGSTRRLLSGALAVDKLAEKARIGVEWIGLSAAERDSLKAAWDAIAMTASQLVVPGIGTFTYVLAAAGGWQEAVDYVNGTTDYHIVRLEFQEQ